MKSLLFQVLVIVGLAAAVGVAANTLRSWQEWPGYVELIVDESRFPNARVCANAKSPELVHEPGAGAGAAATGSQPTGLASSGTRPSTGNSGTGVAAPTSPVGTSPDPASGTGAAATTEQGSTTAKGADAAASSSAKKDGIPHIGLAVARQRWEEGVVFVDARAPKYYEEGHIPGAISIPAWEGGIEARIQKVRDEWGESVPIVLYCNESFECEDSHIVGKQFQIFEFPNLEVFEGGFPGWFRAKLPYVTGAEPGSLDTAVRPEGGPEVVEPSGENE
jgi:rhodanese-related sulfurtransferase